MSAAATAARPLAIDVEAARRALDGKSPEAVLEWAFAAFPRIAISTALGPEGCALVAMAVTVKPDIEIFTIDTDFLFEESIELRNKISLKYGVKIEVLRGEVSIEAQNRKHGLNLWQRDTDLCCALRKVEPTERALKGLDAWLAGLRRDQSKTRADIDVVEYYERPQGPLYKVNPLLHWTRKDTWDYLTKHDIPYNPLLDQGYKSIGCWPCTRPVGADADERAGRWNGQKAECGIHTFMARKG